MSASAKQATTPNVVDIDDPRPWTIKGVSIEARNAAIAAANRERMTQGEWLSRMIPMMVKQANAAERLPAVIPPVAEKTDAEPVPTVAPPVPTIGDLQAATALLETLGPISGSKTAKRLIMKGLLANLGDKASVKKPATQP